MSEPQRSARELIHGTNGPVVIVSGRVAAWMLRYAELEHYHADYRGLDAEIDQTLIALKVAALSWRSSATGMRDAAIPELSPGLQWLSTKQAADALAMTDRAIRKAIRENRLQATTIGRAYRINREQLAHFKARKESA